MTNSQDKIALTTAEQRDVVIQAGIQAIPYVGGSLATLYFGKKQEIRFKRLETFYQEVSEELEDLKSTIASPDKHNQDELRAILEELNEVVETEQSAEKRNYLKNYLKNTLVHPVSGNYDERKAFLQTLSTMTLIECEILGFLYKQATPMKVGAIQKQGVEQYSIIGAVGRLKTFGFLTAFQTQLAIGGGIDNSLTEAVSISPLGKRFCEFCLE
jgi:hypothetical protein